MVYIHRFRILSEGIQVPRGWTKESRRKKHPLIAGRARRNEIATATRRGTLKWGSDALIEWTGAVLLSTAYPVAPPAAAAL